MTKPFTYLIGWSKLDRFYYGVRYGKNAYPDTLWKTYFTSSKTVHTMRIEHGEPDIIQIRKIFKNVESARIWEFKVLRRLNAIANVKMLNLTQAAGMPICSFPGELNPMYGKKHSDETKNKIRQKAIGRKYSLESKLKNKDKNKGSNNPFFGKKHTEETKNKMAQTRYNNRFKPNNHAGTTYEITDPNGVVYVITNQIDNFCKNYQLSRSKMFRCMNIGKIPYFKPHKLTTQYTINCIGWSIYRIPK